MSRSAHVTQVYSGDSAGIARYDALFESCPDAFIQQSTYWAEAIAGMGPDEPIFLICRIGGEDVAGLPLYLYRNELGNVLTSVPQPGPLGGVFVRPGLSAEETEAAYRSLLETALEIARLERCITFSLITNPFVDDLALYERYLQPDYLFENFTQYIRVDEPIHYSRNQRRNLQKAHDFGFTVEPCRSARDFDTWYECHRARHTEIGAKPLDYHLLTNIVERLAPKGKAELLLVRHGDDIASGCIYVGHRHVIDVFILSMNMAFAEHAPNFANTEYSLQWAIERGAKIYNWQSAPNRDSGVYRYKQQWGSVESRYHFVTRRLCSEQRLRDIGAEGLKAAYPWHYVAPFALFTAEPGVREFAKI